MIKIFIPIDGSHIELEVRVFPTQHLPVHTFIIVANLLVQHRILNIESIAVLITQYRRQLVDIWVLVLPFA